MITRRFAIKAAVLSGITVATSGFSSALASQGPALREPAKTETPTPPAGPAGPFNLPPLPYAADALEPHIDAQTMTIHHDKHHAAYVKNLNAALVGNATLSALPIEKLLQSRDEIPAEIRKTVMNNGGGHYNHSLFWQMLSLKGGGEPTGDLAKAINAKFGSFADFQAKLAKEAAGVFGSGWAWLVLDGKELAIDSTPNQDSPISEGKTPLLGIDVWEHAYYLKHQNLRPKYVEAFWNVVSWDFVASRYTKALS